MNLHEKFATFFEEKSLQIFAFLLSKTTAQGSSCMIKGLDYTEALQGSKFEGQPLLWEVLESSTLVGQSLADKRPFVYTQNRLYLFRYFNYEQSIKLNLIKKSLEEKKVIDQRRLQLSALDSLIRRFQSTITSQDKLTQGSDWPLVACLNAFLHNFSIITGGPGTGKTTTIAKLLALLFRNNPSINVALAAPTGKASKRIIESLKDSIHTQPELFPPDFQDFIDRTHSYTLHRLLGYKPNSPYFLHDAAHPLNYDVVIVDEASMIDLPMFSKLLAAIPPNKRLVFLGDHHQLSSIEVGVVLGDMCADNLNNFDREALTFFNTFLAKQAQIPVLVQQHQAQKSLMKGRITGLQHNYRSADYPAIHQISQAILQSNKDAVWGYQNTASAVYIVDYAHLESVLDAYVNEIKAYLQCSNITQALELLHQAKILCAVKHGNYGVHTINKRIEEKLKPFGLHCNSLYYENRPIMVTKNQADRHLFNGEIGIIRQGKAYFLDGNKQLICIEPAYISACETVFALSIHKSQGSEYGSVYILLPTKTGQNLVRTELLYTAVTRAKKKVAIVTNEAILAQSLRHKVQRASGLKQLLYV